MDMGLALKIKYVILFQEGTGEGLTWSSKA